MTKNELERLKSAASEIFAPSTNIFVRCEDILSLIASVEGMQKTLEWIIHPEHDDGDDYTRLGCLKFRANEALESFGVK